jgi:hypothetical protein
MGEFSILPQNSTNTFYEPLLKYYGLALIEHFDITGFSLKHPE